MRQVAQVLKSNGIEGELLVSFRGFDPEDINPTEPVFIYFDGLPVPFYLESFSLRGTNRALVRLTGVRSLSDAEELVARAVWIDEEEYDLEEEWDPTGWTLLESAGTPVGAVLGVEDIPGNTCLVVDTGSAEVLIPFHEDLVLAVDAQEKTLRMQIPDGLLSL